MSKIMAVGIDPGFASLGVSIVGKDEDEFLSFEIISVESKKEKIDRNQGMRVLDDDTRRMAQIYKDLKNLIKPFKPDIAGIEGFAPRPGKGKGWKAAFGYAAAICVFSELDIPIFAFTAMDIKVLISNKKSASKEEVRDTIERKFIPDICWPGPKTKLEHQGDSTAVAILAIIERDRLRKQLSIV